ncbi:low temperature requirement protein A [Humibacillus xanthopallidus]|uniref:Low temperature requirement protein LtrA n=1 Tax=Humibacillus xanthopallidus TaxID=412689 RepID=A0A543HTR7_9MICO|nr:low temperature requirement protein A [Humibacillus xanthopallidus]TQM61753.1 low temperature requirement protein LtrA [Humibacillus xanthopallidus]
MPSTTSPTRRPGGILRPATMRDHDVHERPSTPLELLFDLCFVVAVAVLAAGLDHGIVDGHALEASVTYVLLFVPIWWAWMSYTWYATAFSHDDALTRLLTLLQMAGVLAVAAAIPTAIDGDLLAFSLAYAAMRLPLIVQWLRSAHDDPAHRAFALTYAGGSALAQVGWVVGAVLPAPARAAVFSAALAVELATPVLAVKRSPDRVFHPWHIAERYGLFTIIVLGETILAVSVGLRDVLDGDGGLGSAPAIVGAALVIAFGLWWIYFDALGRDALTRHRRAAFLWGYGHYVLFAAVAAVGAGVQAQLQLDAHGEVTDHVVSAAAVAMPVAVSLAAIAWLQQAANGKVGDAVWLYLGAVVACCALPLAGAWPVAAIDALLAVVVVALVVRELLSQRRITRGSSADRAAARRRPGAPR